MTPPKLFWDASSVATPVPKDSPYKIISFLFIPSLSSHLIISFASSIGATGAMLLSRYIISDYVNKRFAPQVSKIKYDLNKNGTYYLFALRMSPIFPFFIINVAFGLTKIRALAFYFVSQLGMLPGTIIIILIGSELDSFIIEKSPFSFELIIYLSILGLIPLAFKKVVKKN